MSRLRISTVLTVIVALAVVGAGTWFLMRSTPSYPIAARFASGQGLFPGATVSVLGVRVGSVTSVTFEGGSVLVGMSIDNSQLLPEDVDAQLVTPELLGEPDVDLSPGYTGGPRLAAGATIPESRTEVPVSTDQLLAELERVLGAIRPSSARQLIGALASDLSGEGHSINSLLANAASTVSLLASKGNDLGRLNGQLATLTSTLRQHESELASLIDDYDTVAAVLVGHQQQIGQAIDQLASASEELASLLTPNLKPIEQDVAVITTVGRTLDRNLSSLDEAVDSAATLFAGAHRAYDPSADWLNLNDQLSPGMTGSVVEGLVRDRLAGVCRRILANHSAGLTSTALSTLADCGNPNSGYFDPILGNIERVLMGLPSGLPSNLTPAGAGSVLSKALSTIPGLTTAQRQAVSSAITDPPTTTPKGKHKKHKKMSLSQIDGLLNGELGPLPTLLTTSSGSGSSGNTGGLGGLLGAAIGGWL